MRLLFTIPHYFQPTSTYELCGSLRNDPTPRIVALRACILTLHRTFGQQQHGFHFDDRYIFAANTAVPYAIDIAICTTGDRHLLPELDLSEDLYLHVPTEAEPRLLGYECHDLMAEFLGAYDYYCYLEDDILIHDPLFFDKLRWFNTEFGDDRLLQPNTYEISSGEPVAREYVEGEYRPEHAARWLERAGVPTLHGQVLGRDFAFQRATNPHAACFFLNARQMAAWARQPYFGDRSADFFDPMASAATLGIARTFAIYKPAYGNANFLEVQHYGSSYIVSHRRVMAKQLSLQQKFDKSIALCQEALRFEPKNSLTWEALGLAWHDAGKNEDALEACKTAIALDPTRGFAHWAIGEILQERGDISGALHHQQLALQVIPELSDACIKLSYNYLRNGLYREASNLFKMQIAVCGNFPEAYLGLGRVLSRMGEYEEAFQAFNRAIECDPSNDTARYEIGSISIALGRLQESTPWITQVEITTNPEAAELYFKKGTQCLQRQDFDSAIFNLLKSIEADPSLYKAYINTGIAFAGKGMMVESALTLRRGILLAPDIPEAHNNLAIALLALGCYDEAAKSCEQALALRPDYDKARQNLAIAIELLKGMG